jgi:glycine betaine/choline ABC-type transport system substrate-binding protein
MAVGTTADPESTQLANLYAAAFRFYGMPAYAKTVPDPLEALDEGTVNVVPGFTGRLLQTFVPNSAARSDEQVYKSLLGALPEGITAGDYATAAEDKSALAVTDVTAHTWGSRDLTALIKHCAGLKVGAVAGIAPVGAGAGFAPVGAGAGSSPPAAVGGCVLPAPRQFADEKSMFAGLNRGDITAAWIGTASIDVPAELVVLADRKPMLVQAENVVPLYRRNELNEMQLRAINEIAGVLDTAALVDLRRQIADGADPRSVADGWLSTHPLGR